MKKILAALFAFAAVGFILIGCSSSGSSSATTCWETGPGLVIKTVSTTVHDCTAIMFDGDTSSTAAPPSGTYGFYNQACTQTYPTITWQVWGTSANAQSLCDTLGQ